MEDAGQKLKRVRERLGLKYRDVEEASQKIAAKHSNDEFVIALSRLSDIENKKTLPSLFRLYSLCVIYRIEISEVLGWYGLPLASMASDIARVDLERTHPCQWICQTEFSTFRSFSIQGSIRTERPI